MWGFTSKPLLNQFNVRQKGTIRLIGHVSPRERKAPLFSRLKFLTFDEYITYVCLLFVFKTIQYHSSYGWFNFYGNTSYNTRRFNMYILTVLCVRTTHSRQSICYTGLMNWNAVPSRNQTADSYDSFKRQLKLYFFKAEK